MLNWIAEWMIVLALPAFGLALILFFGGLLLTTLDLDIAGPLMFLGGVCGVLCLILSFGGLTIHVIDVQLKGNSQPEKQQIEQGA